MLWGWNAMNDIISDGLEKELGYIIISVFIMLIISVLSPKNQEYDI